LILCSQNARPEKGLVRRPHLDQLGRLSKKGKASELEGIIWRDDGHSMRAVKGSLGPCPKRKVWKIGMHSFDAGARGSIRLPCEERHEPGGREGFGKVHVTITVC